MGAAVWWEKASSVVKRAFFFFRWWLSQHLSDACGRVIKAVDSFVVTEARQHAQLEA